MNHAEFQLRGVSDPRLAVHAASAHPAWLWSVDGTRILWANPVGARLFNAAHGAALANKIFGPADLHRRQVARLAGRLRSNGAIRLERLRGFGAAPGALVTCGCARLDFADGGHGILIASAEAAGRTMPLVERLQRLVEGIDAPIAALTRDGIFVGASTAARSLLGFRNLAEVGLDDACSEALKQGRVETPVGIGHLILQRVGTGADVGLVALIAPGATQAAHTRHAAPASAETAMTEPARQPIVPAADLPLPNHEPSAMSGEAPAEFELIDEFAESPSDAAVEPVGSDQPPEPDEPPPTAPQHPLRFLWQITAERRFSLALGEFSRLIGARTAAAFERPWSDIAERFGLDPDGRFLNAIATRATWTGVTLNWPADGGGRLPVELSGLPIYGRAGNFAGYRGFGICSDLDGMARLAALRRDELVSDPPAQPLSAVIVQPKSADIVETYPGDSLAAGLAAKPEVASSDTPLSPNSAALESNAFETSQPTDLEIAVDTPKNVLPFRPASDPKSPALTQVENSAFNELARQWSARLDNENGAAVAMPVATETVDEQPSTPEAPEPPSEPPEWLAPPEEPARGEARRDKALFDLLPVGVLIYRLDRLLYANRAFLVRMGYESLHALEDAGGLDALYVEPGASSASSTSDTGRPVKISGMEASTEHAPPVATDARLFTISWDGDPALALIFSSTRTEA